MALGGPPGASVAAGAGCRAMWRGGLHALGARVAVVLHVTVRKSVPPASRCLAGASAFPRPYLPRGYAFVSAALPGTPALLSRPLSSAAILSSSSRPYTTLTTAAASEVAAEGTSSEVATSVDFVPLHVHSDFSLLDGASQLPALVERAKELGMKALALTDHGVMYGAIELVKLCKAAGIKPIIGNEMYIAHGNNGPQQEERRRYHLTVLAKDDNGYKNLVRLTSESHLHGMEVSAFHRFIRVNACFRVVRHAQIMAPHVDLFECLHSQGQVSQPILSRLRGMALDLGLASAGNFRSTHVATISHSEGLIVCSGCQSGELAQALLEQDMVRAEAIASWHKKVFGEDYYLEIMDHSRDENEIINKGILKLSQQLDIDVVATNDSHFTHCSDFDSHKALICIKTGSKLTEKPRLSYSGQEYLKSSDEMLASFRTLPQEVVQSAIANTAVIASKVSDYKLFKAPQLPNFDVPPGHDESSYLELVAQEGLCKKLEVESMVDVPAAYLDRLRTELAVIASQGFSAYFLVVWDIIKFARDCNIPVGPGRGSAAGSLVAYALSIINIDPVKHGLLFERFLNEERSSLPDIDTDFCPEQRDKVIEYVTTKYGRERVAQIATFNRLTSKAVLKDVGRVMGLSYAETNSIAKMVPTVRGKATRLEAMVSDNSPSKDFLHKYKDPETKKWVDMAICLEGTHKSFGVHAAGVVISNAARPLNEAVPLQRALGNQGAVVTQYAMDDIESLGLLKMDLLGLKNLTVIRKAYELVKESSGDDLPPMEKLPTDDKKTFELLASGNLDGIFQLETSGGMRHVVRDLKPSRIQDIFAILALYRPGPLDAGLVQEYIDRKHGVEYATPELEPILKETYGVLLYQEQIMRMARDLAGYSLGQADLLRRAMGKKKREDMERERKRFVGGALDKGVEAKVAEELFETMVKFSEYCFNKSHSAAYGYITYMTAYLKANYPVAYMAALMSCAASDTDKIRRYIAACQAMGIELLLPCLNESREDFTIARVGLAAGHLEGLHDDRGSSANGALSAAFEITDVGHGAGKEDNSLSAENLSKYPTGAIWHGLTAVRHIGEGPVVALLKIRDEGGPFKSVLDLCERVDVKVVPKRALKALSGSGALDCLGADYPDDDEEGDGGRRGVNRAWMWKVLEEELDRRSKEAMKERRRAAKEEKKQKQDMDSLPSGTAASSNDSLSSACARQDDGGDEKVDGAVMLEGEASQTAEIAMSLSAVKANTGEDGGGFALKKGANRKGRPRKASVIADAEASTAEAVESLEEEEEEERRQAARVQQSREERCKEQKDLLGYWPDHPIGPLLERLPEWSVPLRLCDAGEPENEGKLVTTAVLVGDTTEKVTKAGRHYATVQLDDCTGQLEGVVFDPAYTSVKELFREDALLLVYGELERRGDRKSAGRNEEAGSAELGLGLALAAASPADMQIKVRGAVEIDKARIVCVQLTPTEATDTSKQNILERVLAGRALQQRGRRRKNQVINTVPVVITIIPEGEGDNALGLADTTAFHSEIREGDGATTAQQLGDEGERALDLTRLGEAGCLEYVYFGPTSNTDDADATARKLRAAGFQVDVRPLLLDKQLASATRAHKLQKPPIHSNCKSQSLAADAAPGTPHIAGQTLSDSLVV
eukprot:SM000285S10794  [mRNA]  locus=s285:54973:64164:+ [translate_table: standard]